MRLSAKDILLTILISFGLLWLLDAVGLGAMLLTWIGDKIPFTAAIPGFTLGEYTITVPPVAALIATLVLAFVVTFIAVAMQEGFQNKKMWATFAILAVISAAIWIVVPQILPIRFGQIAGAAQSMFTGSIPMSVLG